VGRERFVLLGILAMLGACRSVSVPPDDRPFAKGSACAEVRGCFAERGDVAEGEAVPRLSAWLWPKEALDESITSVDFEPADEGTFVVRARAGGRVVRERRIDVPEGHAGPIPLSGGIWLPPFTQQGEEPAPLVGVFRERNALGLDTAGDLELRQTGWVVGLVYLVFPTVFSSEAQYRFPRVACPEREPSRDP
jgi:hypothetical protein